MSVIRLVKTPEKTPTTSLATLVNELLSSDDVVKRAQRSPESADSAYPELVKRVSKILSAQGFKNTVIAFKGLKKRLIDAASSVKDVPPKDVEHAAIAVGSVIIDPCHLRLGTTYDLPSNYQKNLLQRYWDQIHDVKGLNDLKPENVKGIKLLPRYTREDNMLGRDIALSASLDPLFIKYKSNRGTTVTTGSTKFKVTDGTYLCFVQGRSTDRYQVLDLKEGRVIKKFSLDENKSQALLNKCVNVPKATADKLKAVVKQGLSKIKVVENLTTSKQARKASKLLKSVDSSMEKITQEKALKVIAKAKDAQEQLQLKQFYINLLNTKGKAVDKLRAFNIMPSGEKNVNTVKPDKTPFKSVIVAPTTKSPQKIKVILPNEEDFAGDPFHYDPRNGSLKIDSLSSSKAVKEA